MYLDLFGTQVTDAGLVHFHDCKNLVELHLGDTQTTDAGLANFRNCNRLTILNLPRTKAADAGLAYFEDCKSLTSLVLSSTKVTDAGLAHFKDCDDLVNLGLGDTRVTDAGLANFRNCVRLRFLELSSTGATDAGLAHFQGCKNLGHLYLDSTQVTDAGLAHLQDCSNLLDLRLGASNVTDAGLDHLKGCEMLWRVELGGTQVSDAGLIGLAGSPRLAYLDLANTRISLRGYEQIKAALPACQITWSEPNRRIAENVLALGGNVEIGSPGQAGSRAVKATADLPDEFFQVRRVSLAGVAKPLERLPQSLSELRYSAFDRLERLDLSGITGLNYAFLAPIHGLRELTLADAGLSDLSLLGRLPQLPTLTRLVLDGNEFRGTALAASALKQQPELIDLSLGCPTLGDAFIKDLAGLEAVRSGCHWRVAAWAMPGSSTCQQATELEASLDPCRTNGARQRHRRPEEAFCRSAMIQWDAVAEQK